MARCIVCRINCASTRSGSTRGAGVAAAACAPAEEKDDPEEKTELELPGIIWPIVPNTCCCCCTVQPATLRRKLTRAIHQTFCFPPSLALSLGLTLTIP